MDSQAESRHKSRLSISKERCIDMEDYLLEIKDVSKYFPGVLALNHVSFQLRPGTVHALMGENGAGKSTLMKCLLGIYRMDGGSILIDGKEVAITSVRDALDHGISMVQQELSPILERSVMENVWLGRQPMKGPFVDHKKMREDTEQLLEEWGLDIKATSLMKELTVADMQMIEIMKAVSYHARILIMDEPTSALTENEVEKLFHILTRLKSDGIGIIYISHKMDEIFRIADDITVFRDGNYISTYASDQTTMSQLIYDMVGREVNSTNVWRERPIGEEILRVEHLQAEKAFYDISFSLHKGEVLGLAGLVGSGRTETLEAIFGLRNFVGGSVIINGKEYKKIPDPQFAIDRGIAMVPEERRRDGIVPLMDITDNIMIANYKNYLNKFGFLSLKKSFRDSEECAQKLRIKTPDMEEKIENLSGGNQQKVILARWLLGNPDILLLDEPTRGIDVGAKAEIHSLIMELTEQGKAVIMVSSEMPELLAVCDRIAVFRLGRVAGVIQREEATQQSIMSLAAQ